MLVRGQNTTPEKSSIASDLSDIAGFLKMYELRMSSVNPLPTTPPVTLNSRLAVCSITMLSDGPLQNFILRRFLTQKIQLDEPEASVSLSLSNIFVVGKNRKISIYTG